jgi:RNase P/RNase MRP subunit p30
MFVELNLPIYKNENLNKLTKKLEVLKYLGYGCCALNQEIWEPINSLKTRNISIPSTVEGIRLLNRITMVVSKSSHFHANIQELIKFSWTFRGYYAFEVLAVRPLHDSVFSLSCRNSIIHIISIDLTKKLMSKLKPSSIRNAMRRNIMFEICFASALRSNISRRNLFSNVSVLLRATNGNNIVLANGSCSPSKIRNPLEILNFGLNLGLKASKVKNAIGYFPYQCVKKCFMCINNYWTEKAKIDLANAAMIVGISRKKLHKIRCFC